MLDFLMGHLPYSAQITGSYYEPFVGGGVIFFSLNPKYAILSDVNKDLIDLYLGIQQDAKSVWQLFSTFGNTKTDYLHIRDTNPGHILTNRAARVLFLNRTCFKGMWRHNKDGNFNVGYGGQDRRWVISEENLLGVENALKNTNLLCCDFETIIDRTLDGDFIFADPPYRPGEKEQLHSHYTGRKFVFSDHMRLAQTLTRASNRNVKWALTISSCPEIIALYSGNQIVEIPRGTGRKPGTTTDKSGEVLITNYLQY